MKKVNGKKGKTAPRRTPAGEEFPIVGIGASAGGLEAFTHVLKHLPADTGMAFVLIQHLDPTHESALAQILARATSMRVHEVTNDLQAEPNTVYVIPPNTCMEISGHALQLQPRRDPASSQHSIDTFFESLAREHHERAIGVILSGTASDGTIGLESIKAEGGITIAQNETAKYDSMPRSAIASGCVDLVLSPESIAREIARIARHPSIMPEGNGKDASARAHPVIRAGETKRPVVDENNFKRILHLLHVHSGVDFTFYKSSTIQRRLVRRMLLCRRASLDDYAQFLRGNTRELDALYGDMLINVTGFFRNPEAFEALKRKVFPALFHRRRDDPIRVWIPGCSTGQEAYSVAILLMEYAEHLSTDPPSFQVFATDLSEAALEKGRAGLYARSLVPDVSPERLQGFFLEEDGGCRIKKNVREKVIFARHNLVTDPPFSRIDLICCRNLLIYLNPELQKKIIPAFHYALKPEGILFLGLSESVDSFGELFEVVERKYKLYSRLEGQMPAFRLPLPNRPGAIGEATPKSSQDGSPWGPPVDSTIQREADRMLLKRYSPTGVLINDGLHILQFRGATAAYLEHPAGKASFDLLKMVREGLLLPLRAAITKAKKEDKPTRAEDVPVGREDDRRTITLEVIPLKHLKERYYWVLFEEHEPEAGLRKPNRRRQAAPRKEHAADRRSGGEDDKARRIGELETELSELHSYLQTIREQHDAANEELQTSNEELQSSNEELQSINEEMETTKEELESANEELITVNEEMANRNAELGRLNSDLNNLSASINTAILMLGRDLTVRRFTPIAEKIFNLLAGDVGRPIGNIRHTLEFAGLEQLLTDVMHTGSIRDQEVRDTAGHWYSLRARPYVSLDNSVDGVVVFLVDIDALKQNEQALSERTDKLLQATTQLETFVYSIAHDLRAPLRAITGYSEMLKEDFGATLNEKTIGYIDTITHSAQSLDHLLLDLLEYSRIVSAHIEMVPVSLKGAVTRALARCEKDIQAANAAIDVVPPLPVVHAHAPTLGQVLINLLSNAIKFVAPGAQPAIRIRAEERPGVVRLWIEDNGIGIDPEIINTIFEVFERGHCNQYSGTGIGLAIVRKGIERMGGRVGVVSIPGKGSRFWFDLLPPTNKDLP